MICICMLGGFSISIGDDSVRFPTVKTSTLAAHLLWHQDEWLPRVRLWSLLWPESPESRAASNLRQTVYRLRHALAEVGLEHLLEVRRDALRLSPNSAELHVDAIEFEAQALAALDDSEGCLTGLTQALSLYSGPFLAGLEGNWFDEQRIKLDGLYLATLRQTVDKLRAAGLCETAIPHAKRWVALEPMNEEAHRAVMQLYSDSGNPAGALQQFEECRTILRDELDIAPSPETLELCEQIGLHPHKSHARRHRSTEPQRYGSVRYSISDDPLYKAGLLLALGQKHADLGEMDEALEQLEKARAIYEEYADEEGLARVALALGTAYIGIGMGPRPEVAVPYVDQALVYFEQQPDSPTYVRALYLASLTSGLVGDLKGQFELASKGLSMAEAIGNRDWQARFETLLAIRLITECRFAEAKEHLDHVSHLLPYLADMSDVAMFMMYHAFFPLLVGDLRTSKERHEELLAVTETLPFGATRAMAEIPARMLLMTVLYFEGAYDRVRRLNPLPDYSAFLPEYAISVVTLLMRPADFAQACKAAAEVLEASFSEIIDEQVTLFIRLMSEFLWEAGLLDEHAEWIAKGIAYTEEQGWPACAAVFYAYRARVAAERGDTAVAVEDCARAEAGRDPLDRWTELVIAWARGLLARDGDDAGADAGLGATIELAAELGFGHYIPQLEAATAKG